MMSPLVGVATLAIHVRPPTALRACRAPLYRPRTYNRSVVKQLQDAEGQFNIAGDRYGS